MARNRNKDKSCGWFGANWWQSASVNQRLYQKNLNWIISLAQNRFRWVNVPETCNVRFLEQTLLCNGIATIAFEKSMPDVWLSLQASSSGKLNMYGDPVEWQARGINGETYFDVNSENGVIIYDHLSQLPQWDAFQLLARRLTHYEIVENCNLSQQMTPYLITAPDTKKQELINIYKQLAGGEMAILGDDSLREHINVSAISTQTPFIGAELNSAKQTCINEVYRLLGIDHLAFEKKERLTQTESEANTDATSLMLLDCLTARRMACEELNKKFGLNIQVVFNEDIESYNWNFENNLESLTEVKNDAISNI